MRERLCILKMGVTALDDATLLQSAVRATEIQGRPPPNPHPLHIYSKKDGTPWAGRYHIILRLKIQFQHGQQGLTTVGTKLLHRKPRKNIQPWDPPPKYMYVRMYTNQIPHVLFCYLPYWPFQRPLNQIFNKQKKNYYIY